MGFEELANSAAKNSSAVAVDDTHARQSGKKCVVEIFLEFIGCLVYRAADEIDLRAHFVGVRAGHSNVHALLLSGRSKRINFSLPRLPLPGISRKTRRRGAIVPLHAHLDRPQR